MRTYMNREPELRSSAAVPGPRAPPHCRPPPPAAPAHTVPHRRLAEPGSAPRSPGPLGVRGAPPSSGEAPRSLPTAPFSLGHCSPHKVPRFLCLLHSPRPDTHCPRPPSGLCSDVPPPSDRLLLTTTRFITSTPARLSAAGHLLSAICVQSAVPAERDVALCLAPGLGTGPR